MRQERKKDAVKCTVNIYSGGLEKTPELGLPHKGKLIVTDGGKNSTFSLQLLI